MHTMTNNDYAPELVAEATDVPAVRVIYPLMLGTMEEDGRRVFVAQEVPLAGDRVWMRPLTNDLLDRPIP